MSRENVDVVRRMVERWNAGDVEGWLRCWHTDAEWISEPPFRALEGRPRTYRGHAELRRFPVDVLDGFTDLGQIERPRFQDVGESVVVLAEYRAKGGASGPEVATSSGWLSEVRDGRIARGRGFVDQRQALDAVGLRE
jgi:ketosteroid isomerase-like protein